MARNQVAKYVWLIDTVERRKRITFDELSEQWRLSSLSDGKPLSRRTFFNYRDAIYDMFGITLACDRATYEYYIAHDETEAQSRLSRWLLDSMSINGMLSDSQDVSSRIILENVPSARQHLPIVVQAMKQGLRIKYDYHSYQRVNATHVTLEPYFVKIFKQLWYVIGFDLKDKRVKTYALDRMTDLHITGDKFTMPQGFDPMSFFKDCFGITSSQDEPKDIVLRATSTQAKYMRALPLHPSQREEVHDSYSIFHYRMKLTYDLKEEIMSRGSNIEVISPPELKAQIVTELKNALSNY